LHFSEPEILSFTKYVNHRVTPLPHADGHHIYAIRCSYYGIKLEDNNSEEGEVEVDHFLDTDDDDEEVEAFDDEPDENEKGSGNAS
jgi:hypothetical protein